MPEPGPTLVLAALDEELAPIRRALEGAAVVLAATGDGPRRAASQAARVLERHRPGAVVGAGLAGALTPDLAVGDLVVSRRVRGETGDAPTPDAALTARAEALGARPATLVTVDRPVVTVAAKSALGAPFRASGGGAAAVDMESAAWAQAASARGIPYVVVRVISDGADESLPEFLAEAVGSDGSIHRTTVVRRALFEPGSWGTLLRMRRRMHEGSTKLAAFLVRLLGVSG